MKKYTILAACVLSFAAARAQVGIGTTAPAATLHIKTENPYIMRIEDTTNTDSNAFLIQSADTGGTMQKVATDALFRSAVIIQLTTDGATVSTAYSTATQSWQNTGVAVKLPPGKWNLSGTIAMVPSTDQTTNGSNAFNGRLSLADNINATTSSNDLVAIYPASQGGGNMFGRVASPAMKDFITGNILVNNATGADKTYYILANIERLGSSPSGVNFINFGSSKIPENQLYALPINDN